MIHAVLKAEEELLKKVNAGLKPCVWGEGDRAQGVACSCVASWPTGGKGWSCSGLVFYTLTEPLLWRKIIHSLSSLRRNFVKTEAPEQIIRNLSCDQPPQYVTLFVYFPTGYEIIQSKTDVAVESEFYNMKLYLGTELLMELY